MAARMAIEPGDCSEQAGLAAATRAEQGGDALSGQGQFDPHLEVAAPQVLFDVKTHRRVILKRPRAP